MVKRKKVFTEQLRLTVTKEMLDEINALKEPDEDRLDLIRSAIANSSRLIDGLDRRVAWARRLRDCIELQTAALGPPDELSEFEHVLVRRSAMLTMQLEAIEREWSEAEDGKASRQYLTCTVGH